MASDAYLQIDGIKGESTDLKHQGWIEVTDVQFGVTQPRSATASTSDGHTAERAELSDIVLTKVSDISSPILSQTCAMGKTIPKAKIEFMREVSKLLGHTDNRMRKKGYRRVGESVKPTK